MNKRLTKDEELHFGGLVQDMHRARKEMTEAEEAGALTPEARISFQARVREGERAVDTLVRCNTALVWDRARKFKAAYPGGHELDDLAQEGMAGLMTAIHKFDPARGNKLSTVAHYWIQQAITRGTNKTARLVRLPENRVSDFTNISKARARYEGSSLSSGEIDRKVMVDLDLTQGEFMDITNAAATPASLNKVTSSEGGAKEFIEFVSADNPTEAADAFVMKAAIFEILGEKLSSMTPLQRDILSASFMLAGPGMLPLSPKEVRETHGISTARFKKVLNETLQGLKGELSSLDISFEDFID
jgi:RNA polymerase sigma factor (sigma-70 family)